MRTAKKIVWVILALLPVLTFVWLIVGQLGQQKSNPIGAEGLDVMMFWTDVNVTEQDNTYCISNYEETADVITLTELCLFNFVGFNPEIEKSSVMGAYCGIYKILAEDCRIPASGVTFFGMLYLFYLAFLELVSLLVDLILFVPRKCGEIFR